MASTMEMQMAKLLIGVLSAMIGFQSAHAVGVIEIHFLRFGMSCTDNVVQDCDPYFTFCASKPSASARMDDCYYGRVGSSHFHNDNHFDFSHWTNINGIANPWRIRSEQLMDRIQLNAEVHDHESWPFSNEHLHTWKLTFNLDTYGSQREAAYKQFTMSSGSYSWIFEARQYCEDTWFSPSCTVKCVPRDDSSGHYECDRETGRKICLKGWTGASCTNDIDECSDNVCMRGNCTNTPGSFSCQCPENYYGDTCEHIKDACESSPCENGGVCVLHNDTYGHICECAAGWEGDLCGTRQDPCISQPCLHGGDCTSVNQNTEFTCSCKYPYSGNLCDVDIATTKLPTEEAVAGQQLGDEQEENNEFHLWYVLLIISMVLLILIVAVAVFFIRKTRNIKENMYFDNPVAFNGSQLAFENDVYAQTNRNNQEIERSVRTVPIVPASPPPAYDNHDFDKPSLSCAEMCAEVNETQGAVGGKEPIPEDDCCSTDVKMRPRIDNTQTNTEMNPYADFETLKRQSQVVRENEYKENDYQDLEEVAASLGHSFDLETDKYLYDNEGKQHYDDPTPYATPHHYAKPNTDHSSNQRRSHYDHPPSHSGSPKVSIYDEPPPRSSTSKVYDNQLPYPADTNSMLKGGPSVEDNLADDYICETDIVIPPPIPSRPDIPPDNSAHTTDKQNNHDACEAAIVIPPPIPSRPDLPTYNADYMSPDVASGNPELACIDDYPTDNGDIDPAVTHEDDDSCPLEITGQTTYHDMCMENPAFQSDV